MNDFGRMPSPGLQPLKAGLIVVLAMAGRTTSSWLSCPFFSGYDRGSASSLLKARETGRQLLLATARRVAGAADRHFLSPRCS